MAWAVTADPVKFETAEAWFDSRFPVDPDLLEELGEFAGSRAWTVAGVTQLDIILEIYESIRDALEDGTPLDEWRKALRARIGERWGAKTSARLETIFRTNVQTAYNRGRWVQMGDPEVVAVRPFKMFDAVMDSRTSPICRPIDKTVLPHDDPFWDAHLPPLHFSCRSSIRSLTESSAKKRGISKQAPESTPQEGFGKAPTADEWRPDPDKYPAELWRIFEEKQAAR